jgi:GT2 family glycosyltransferase
MEMNAKSEKDLSIVILNWNGTAMLRRFLPSVIKHSSGQADIVVADNASTDDSVEVLRTEFPSVRIIALDKNYGFAEGYNRALREVDSDLYLLLNSDVEVTEGWLSPLLDFMASHPECAACQPKLLAETARDTFEYAGACGGYIDRYGYPFCRGRLFETVEKDQGQYDNVAEVLWATGACLLIRRDDYWNVGGLDGRFFAHNEEIDLCWRLCNLGRKIFCVPQSKVFHVGGGTLPKGNPKKTFFNFRNNLTMLYKNLPDSELAHVMTVRCVLDYVAAFKMLIADRNVAEFMAVCCARRAFKKWKKEFRADREHILRTRVAEHLVGRCGYSLLWKYYFGRKHRFSDLEKS